MSSLAPPPVAPPAAPPARSRWAAPVATGVGVAAATALLAVGDPNTTHVPLCPLKAVTGLDCPFCGSLRAVHGLAHLDVADAANHNLLFTLAAPLLVAGWVLWLAASLGHPLDRHLGAIGRFATRQRSGRPLPRAASWAFWLLVASFGVARNLPPFAWLASGT